MHSSLRTVPSAVTAMVVVFQIASLPARATAEVGPAAARCQQAIVKAGAAFVTRGIAELGRCATTILTCVEVEARAPACLAAASERCERGLAHLARRRVALARLVAARCAGVAPDVLVAADGLAFADLGAVCPALGTGRGDAGVVGACVAGIARCEGERLLATLVPRSGELLRIAGVPPSTDGALACLPDHGGSGRSDRADGPTIAACARRTARAGLRITARTLAGFAACGGAALPCLDRTDASCVAAARAVCDRVFTRLASARTTFDRLVASKCEDARVPFASLAAPVGANLAALSEDCARGEVGGIHSFEGYATCLAHRQACALATIARIAMPRLPAALALVGHTFPEDLCGDPPPSPTATPTPRPRPTPTATTTGPTPTPRPGETATPTPQPTATPFCGDAIVDDPEECDGDELEDNECDDLCEDPSPRGVLACSPACTFDFSGCGPDAGCEP